MAPDASTLDEAAVPPMASPLSGLRPSAQAGTGTETYGAFGPAPFHDETAVPAGQSNPFAPWALGLSCLALLAFLAVNITMGMKATSLVGTPAVTSPQDHWLPPGMCQSTSRPPSTETKNESLLGPSGPPARTRAQTL